MGSEPELLAEVHAARLSAVEVALEAACTLIDALVASKAMTVGYGMVACQAIRAASPAAILRRADERSDQPGTRQT